MDHASDAKSAEAVVHLMAGPLLMDIPRVHLTLLQPWSEEARGFEAALCPTSPNSGKFRPDSGLAQPCNARETLAKVASLARQLADYLFGRSKPRISGASRD